MNTDGSNVEIVESTKFLGVHLPENLTWSLNISSITKKAQQCLYFLRRLRKAHLPPPILPTFYILSILSSCITAWFENCTISDCKTLQRIVRTAEIIRVSLSSIMDIYSTRSIHKANSIRTELSSGKRKDLSEFDQGQIVMARRLDQSISKTAAHVGCFQSAVVSIYQKWSKEGTMVNQ
ncbi:hypothetical protein QTP70_014043 [Hemibagrus guttatus]|uniref:Alkylated DNA repair protein AlkB homologue 8 N-terminal domain-containing protein n=1 Tax=Hemibagrus guttatus TaxID=175788 RepID=A0AAE0R481_9TELE|nr:hypothetical protein QTP70_014043 [Hemibagrus guttatus]KAK3569052.1 hypothetical protein QTP86_021538 [Hemibagrus guttatus]